MAEIVDYQLRRASATGRSVMQAAVPVAAVVRKVVDALDKAYRDKGVQCRFTIDPEARFQGDEADLMEILGNLLDNAYKWCHREVAIDIRQETGHGAWPYRLHLCIEDDGPGIAGDVSDHLFERGARADTAQEGQGIGLAVVRDIVRIYGGTVTLGRGSILRGARVVVVL
jgi:two-component system sensor histidine kinase PhoQ